jgi:hypothetical protein
MTMLRCDIEGRDVNAFFDGYVDGAVLAACENGSYSHR